MKKKIKLKFGKGRGKKKANENIDNICFLMGSLFARSVFQWGEWNFFFFLRLLSIYCRLSLWFNQSLFLLDDFYDVKNLKFHVIWQRQNSSTLPNFCDDFSPTISRWWQYNFSRRQIQIVRSMRWFFNFSTNWKLLTSENSQENKGKGRKCVLEVDEKSCLPCNFSVLNSVHFADVFGWVNLKLLQINLPQTVMFIFTFHSGQSRT